MLTTEEILVQLNERMQSLERDNRLMRLGFAGALVLSFGILATAYFLHSTKPVLASSDDKILHVRGLVVEDANGVERVRIGAPLPDPMEADGVRHRRAGVISGLLISDAKGTERGGYVTADATDEAFFTLDSRKGQEVLFLANPGGGTNFDLFDREGNEANITVFPKGPNFVMKQRGKIIAQIPNTDSKADRSNP